MPIPKTGGETKGGRQVEYRSHFNFSIKWWFHPLWEPGDTAQATRVAKKCFLATIRALQKEVGAPYFGAQNCTAVCIRLLLRPCYTVLVPNQYLDVLVPDQYPATSAEIY